MTDGRLLHRTVIAHNAMVTRTYRRFALIGPWVETWVEVEKLTNDEQERILAELAAGEVDPLALPCVPHTV